jgi:hypothetical protein
MSAWQIEHSIYANIMRRGTCTVRLKGDTAISTIKLNSHDRHCSIIEAWA